MGFIVGNTAGTVILRALWIMIASWIIGRGIGAVAQRVIEIQIEEYKIAHPLPPLSKLDASEDGQAQEADVHDGEPAAV